MFDVNFYSENDYYTFMDVIGDASPTCYYINKESSEVYLDKKKPLAQSKTQKVTFFDFEGKPYDIDTEDYRILVIGEQGENGIFKFHIKNIPLKIIENETDPNLLYPRPLNFFQPKDADFFKYRISRFLMAKENIVTESNLSFSKGISFDIQDSPVKKELNNNYLFKVNLINGFTIENCKFLLDYPKVFSLNSEIDIENISIKIDPSLLGDDLSYLDAKYIGDTNLFPQSEMNKLGSYGISKFRIFKIVYLLKPPVSYTDTDGTVKYKLEFSECFLAKLDTASIYDNNGKGTDSYWDQFIFPVIKSEYQGQNLRVHTPENISSKDIPYMISSVSSSTGFFREVYREPYPMVSFVNQFNGTFRMLNEFDEIRFTGNYLFGSGWEEFESFNDALVYYAKNNFVEENFYNKSTSESYSYNRTKIFSIEEITPKVNITGFTQRNGNLEYTHTNIPANTEITLKGAKFILGQRTVSFPEIKIKPLYSILTYPTLEKISFSHYNEFGLINEKNLDVLMDYHLFKIPKYNPDVFEYEGGYGNFIFCTDNIMGFLSNQQVGLYYIEKISTEIEGKVHIDTIGISITMADFQRFYSGDFFILEKTLNGYGLKWKKLSFVPLPIGNFNNNYNVVSVKVDNSNNQYNHFYLDLKQVIDNNSPFTLDEPIMNYSKVWDIYDDFATAMYEEAMQTSKFRVQFYNNIYDGIKHIFNISNILTVDKVTPGIFFNLEGDRLKFSESPPHTDTTIEGARFNFRSQTVLFPKITITPLFSKLSSDNGYKTDDGKNLDIIKVKFYKDGIYNSDIDCHVVIDKYYFEIPQFDAKVSLYNGKYKRAIFCTTDDPDGYIENYIYVEQVGSTYIGVNLLFDDFVRYYSEQTPVLVKKSNGYIYRFHEKNYIPLFTGNYSHNHIFIGLFLNIINFPSYTLDPKYSYIPNEPEPNTTGEFPWENYTSILDAISFYHQDSSSQVSLYDVEDNKYTYFKTNVISADGIIPPIQLEIDKNINSIDAIKLKESSPGIETTIIGLTLNVNSKGFGVDQHQVSFPTIKIKPLFSYNSFEHGYTFGGMKSQKLMVMVQSSNDSDDFDYRELIVYKDNYYLEIPDYKSGTFHYEGKLKRIILCLDGDTENQYIGKSESLQYFYVEEHDSNYFGIEMTRSEFNDIENENLYPYFAIGKLYFAFDSSIVYGLNFGKKNLIPLMVGNYSSNFNKISGHFFNLKEGFDTSIFSTTPIKIPAKVEWETFPNVTKAMENYAPQNTTEVAFYDKTTYQKYSYLRNNLLSVDSISYPVKVKVTNGIISFSSIRPGIEINATGIKFKIGTRNISFPNIKIIPFFSYGSLPHGYKDDYNNMFSPVEINLFNENGFIKTFNAEIFYDFYLLVFPSFEEKTEFNGTYKRMIVGFDGYSAIMAGNSKLYFCEIVDGSIIGVEVTEQFLNSSNGGYMYLSKNITYATQFQVGYSVKVKTANAIQMFIGNYNDRTYKVLSTYFNLNETIDETLFTTTPPEPPSNLIFPFVPDWETTARFFPNTAEPMPQTIQPNALGTGLTWTLEMIKFIDRTPNWTLSQLRIGITINSKTGLITANLSSSTFSQSAEVEAKLTVKNIAGEVSKIINIYVDINGGGGSTDPFTYPASSYSLKNNTPINPINPVFATLMYGYPPQFWHIHPQPPNGVIFNYKTGSISGTLNVKASSSVEYTVYALQSYYGSRKDIKTTKITLQISL